MSTDDLFGELRRLNKADKLRAMEILVLELAAEEDVLLSSHGSYEVWSPLDSAGAAKDLQQMLEEAANSTNG